ncbi:hypothetical protein GXP71_02290 [Cellulomonas sp. H30R-01]|uniref:hypothetical protein n=1 Tax=Cellulomonas sp. H30R-01 TaxID=2704467 RepID=UPI00138B54F5|nr:hypothetical protein [Cellulomonas sp. H30R-01]QHT55028.1 hypothetical protein GXP71_02290 [Cellulomonas sp. H30R-01]
MGDFSMGTSEVIAGLALTASIISLLISWRSAHRSTKITTYRSATDLTLDIDHQFVEHPELRPYFYQGREPSDVDATLSARVDAMAELMLDCFECIWDIRKTYSAADRISWGHYILDMLGTSPAMQRMFAERRPQDWYPALDDLHRVADEGRLRPRWTRPWASRGGTATEAPSEPLPVASTEP